MKAETALSNGAEDLPVDQAAPGMPVLVIDLDGTLCRTDTLHENIIALVARHPVRLPALLAALGRGKAEFKRLVAAFQVTPGAGLPYEETVLDLIRRARAEGRRVALVSASDQRQVDEVAAHLGLFDEAFGTGGAAEGRNLGGREKAAFLVARYGRGGFDYVGDAHADLPVWAEARGAITLGAGERLRRAVAGVNSQVSHLTPASGGTKARALIRALRPHQWSKNILVFLPMLTAHDFSAFPAALTAFVAFSLTASSVYLINDLVDLQADRIHPRKRNRPFAAGTVPIAAGMVLAPILVLAAAALAALWTTPAFLAVLLAYYIVTFAYSFWLKRKLVVDVLTLASLYTMRIVAGAAATGLVLSPWMLGFSMFLFLSLAAVKRQAELSAQMARGAQESRKAAGRGYETDDLPLLREMALAAGYASVVVFALYISSEDVLRLYSRPEALWLICPLLLYWISRMVIMTHRGFMTDDPIVYAARDWPSRLVVLISVGIVIVGAGL